MLTRKIGLTLMSMIFPLVVGCVQGEFEYAEENPELSPYAQIRVCANGDTLEGVDISYHNPDADWDKVANSGRRFAFARLSYGYKFIDPDFQTNWEGIKAAGMYRGAYQYFRPSQDAKMQAEVVVDALGALEKGDLPVVLDIEETEGKSAASIVASLEIWIDIVTKGTGRAPIIYTSWGFWNSIGEPDGFGHLNLWVANFGATCPLVPAPWKTWKFWQYAETGSVPGYTTLSDVNKFNGTEDDLKALAGYDTNSTSNVPGCIKPGAAYSLDHCSVDCPCAKGEGDCDSDEQCEDGLVCRADVGANYGAPSYIDICEEPENSETSCHTTSPFSWTYCTADCPCAEGEGDCDNDSECQSGLTCVKDVGAQYGTGSTVDICL